MIRTARLCRRSVLLQRAAARDGVLLFPPQPCAKLSQNDAADRANSIALGAAPASRRASLPVILSPDIKRSS